MGLIMVCFKYNVFYLIFCYKVYNKRVILIVISSKKWYALIAVRSNLCSAFISSRPRLEPVWLPGANYYINNPIISVLHFQRLIWDKMADVTVSQLRMSVSLSNTSIFNILIKLNFITLTTILQENLKQPSPKGDQWKYLMLFTSIFVS